MSETATETTKPTPVDKIRAFIVESVGEDMGPEMTRQAESLAERVGLAGTTGPTSPVEEHGSVLGGALAYIEYLLGRIVRLKAAAPAPEVREVPAGEAREGDTVTRTGAVAHTFAGGFAVTWAGGREGNNYPNDAAGFAFTRPVSPLPDERGVFGSISPFGSGHRFNVMTVERDGQLLFVASNGSEYHPHEVTDFQPLPAGAGAPVVDDVVEEPPMGASIRDARGERWTRYGSGWSLTYGGGGASWEYVRKFASLPLIIIPAGAGVDEGGKP